MQREGVKLTPLHQRVVLATLASTAATGILWLVFHYFLRVTGEFGETAHPLEAWWLSLHGGAAMGALLALGSLVRGHVSAGWRAQRNRASGGAVVAMAVVLSATGWALYYIGSETLRPIMSVVHWGVGLAGLTVIPIHIRAGRRDAANNTRHGRRGGHRHARRAEPTREAVAAGAASAPDHAAPVAPRMVKSNYGVRDSATDHTRS